MTVSSEDVGQMASFMRALNPGMEPIEPQSYTATNADLYEDRKVDSTRVVTSDVKEMKDILARFYAAADGAVQRVTEDAVSDSSLREALITERTATGSRIGAWEIQMHQEGKRKFYDVVAVDGTSCIASDLTLYEAAHGLVRILNGGGKLNSPDAINLLRAEQDYAGAVNDAVLYKHYLTKNPGDNRAIVFEARYSAAKTRAVSARGKVSAISERC